VSAPADDQTCAEVTGCVTNAITDGNTNWNNSYGFITSESDPQVGDVSTDEYWCTAETSTNPDSIDCDLKPMIGTLANQRVPRWSSSLSQLVNGAIRDNGSTVGIGTAQVSGIPLNVVAGTRTTPSIQVDRNSAGISIQALDEGEANDHLIMEGGGDGSQVYLNYFNSGDVNFADGGGRVKIDMEGLTASTAKLDVNGMIRTRPVSSATCNANNEGSIFYDSDTDKLNVCTTAGWAAVH